MVEKLAWYDMFRVCTMLFCLVSLYISARRAKDNWSRYTQRLKELVWATHAFLILMIEGSLEQMLKNIEGGPRTVLSLLISAAFLRAVSRDEGYIKPESEN